MSRLSSLVVLFCVAAVICETFAAPDEPILLRSKRQQCRCVKNPNGGLTCSCAKGPANGSSSSSPSTYTIQQDMPTDIANQLTAMQQQTPGHSQARCGCIQIVLQGAPQYNCQCGDQNGNQLPTSTTMTPTTSTTTTTLAPTTSTTTTTTQSPVSYPSVPTQTQGPSGNGACNCIMISITSPQTAQYQCQCANPQQNQTNNSETQYEYPPQTEIPGTLPPPSSQTTTPSTTTTSTTTPSPQPATLPTPTQSMITAAPPTVYPSVGTLATPTEACYCVDPVSNTMSQYCGCSCNCLTMMVSTPNAYCGCPQQAQAYPTETYDYTQAYQTQPTTTTVAPTLAPTFAPTFAPIAQTTTPSPTTPVAPLADASSATQYPLTTTCVMYVNVPLTACSCLPQYDQCAQNVCCLKSKFRSYKKPEETAPTTIDMLMNVLQTIKTKLE